MPIHFEGKAVGCININSRKKNIFGKENMKLLEIVSQQIEVAINNAKRVEALDDLEACSRFGNLRHLHLSDYDSHCCHKPSYDLSTIVEPVLCINLFYSYYLKKITSCQDQSSLPIPIYMGRRRSLPLSIA
jgi:hypothetical protein